MYTIYILYINTKRKYQTMSCCAFFIYITAFQEDSERGSMVGRWVGSGVGS